MQCWWNRKKQFRKVKNSCLLLLAEKSLRHAVSLQYNRIFTSSVNSFFGNMRKRSKPIKYGVLVWSMEHLICVITYSFDNIWWWKYRKISFNKNKNNSFELPVPSIQNVTSSLGCRTRSRLCWGVDPFSSEQRRYSPFTVVTTTWDVGHETVKDTMTSAGKSIKYHNDRVPWLLRISF